MCQNLPVSQRGGSQHPDSGTRSQTFRQQLLKVCSYIQICEAVSLSPMGHQNQAIWSRPLAEVTNVSGLQTNACAPFWKMLVSWIKAEGEHRGGIHSLPSSRETPQSTRHVPDAKSPSSPGLQDKQRDFTERLGAQTVPQCTVHAVLWGW